MQILKVFIKSLIVLFVALLIFLFIADKIKNTPKDVVEQKSNITVPKITHSEPKNNVVPFIRRNDREKVSDDELWLFDLKSSSLKSLGIKNVGKVFHQEADTYVLYQLNGTENEDKVIIYDASTNTTNFISEDPIRDIKVRITDAVVTSDHKYLIYEIRYYTLLGDKKVEVNRDDISDGYYIYNLENSQKHYLGKGFVLTYVSHDSKYLYAVKSGSEEANAVRYDLATTKTQEIENTLLTEHYFHESSFELKLESKEQMELVLSKESSSSVIDSGNIFPKVDYSPNNKRAVYYKDEGNLDLSKKILDIEKGTSQLAIISNNKDDFVEFYSWIDDENLVLLQIINVGKGEKFIEGDLYNLNVVTNDVKRLTDFTDIKGY